MALSRVSRTKESFMEKITSQSESSQAGIAGAISNFFNFSRKHFFRHTFFVECFLFSKLIRKYENKIKLY